MKHNKIILAGLMASMISSACDKAFDMKLPLAVDSHKLSLRQEEGSTHILVYADGSWTAAFDRDIEWAALDRTSGKGNSEIVFTYTENLGIARQARLVLSRGELKDTVFLTQAGPVTNPSYRFTSRSNTLAVGGGLVSFPVVSNLEYSTDALMVAAIFHDGDVRDTVSLAGGAVSGPYWITAAKAYADHLDLELDYNVTKAERHADILVTIDDPTGRTMKSVMSLTQTADKPELQLASVSGTFGSEAQTALVRSVRNNIYAYDADTIFKISGGDGWLSGVHLTKDGLEFVLEENTTGAMRSATISITYIDDFAAIVKTGFTIVQKG